MKRFIWTKGVWQWVRDKYVLIEREGYDYEGPVSQAMDNPTMRLLNFQFFNDDGTDETDSTSRANKDTDITGQALDENLLIRFVVDETAGNASTNYKPQLEYRLNSGTWTSVTDISVVARASDSTKLTDGGDTTQRIGVGTFLTNNDGVDDVNGSAGSSVTDYVGNDEAEFVYCVQIRSADVSGGDTVDFRISDGDIDTYTVTHGRATVTGGQTISVGLATEADSSLAVSAAKLLSAGLNTEADSSLAVVAAKQLQTGLVTSAESSLAVSALKFLTAGLPVETDSSLAVTTGGQVIVVGLVSESDTSLVISVLKALLVGLISETGSALGVTRTKSKAGGLVSVSDSSLAATVNKGLTAGLVSETDSAFPIAGPTKTILVGLVSEVNSALSVIFVGAATIGKLIKATIHMGFRM